MEKIDKIVAENIFNGLTVEQKNKIVIDFVNEQMDTNDTRIRNKINDLMVNECLKEIELRRPEIRETVNKILDEKLSDKDFFQTVMIKHRIKAFAKSIIDQI